jgi:hypothetical protein
MRGLWFATTERGCDESSPHIRPPARAANGVSGSSSTPTHISLSARSAASPGGSGANDSKSISCCWASSRSKCVIRSFEPLSAGSGHQADKNKMCIITMLAVKGFGYATTLCSPAPKALSQEISPGTNHRIAVRAPGAPLWANTEAEAGS